MVEKGERSPFESEEMKEWLEKYVLDPFTAYLDEAVFRIDFFDSDTAFIIEAQLPGAKKEDIKVTADGCSLKISVQEKHPATGSVHAKMRTISFPFSLKPMKIEANLYQDILEIRIHKNIAP